MHSLSCSVGNKSCRELVDLRAYEINQEKKKNIRLGTNIGMLKRRRKCEGQSVATLSYHE
jgi:hypothetical protein